MTSASDASWLLVCLFAVPLLAAGCSTSGPRFRVPEGAVLRGDPVDVGVEGLAPGERVSIAAAGVDQLGGRWSSQAAFVARQDGTVDLSRDAPISGSYVGASREGLFWSMALAPDAKVQTPMVSVDEVVLTLADTSGAERARATIAFTDRVEVTEVELDGALRGSLFVPRGAAPRRAVVVLGGSEGGSRADLAARLASRLRVPALALAYFRVPGSPLPDALQEVPLEYFAGALDWLDHRPEVTPGGPVLLGVSRGAELALLLASTWPGRIRGVVANVPSHVVWPGEGAAEGAPAWTLGGRAVPFVPIAMTEAQAEAYGRAMQTKAPYAFRDVYAGSLATAPRETVDAAAIPVERIGGPVLLLGSGMDGVWPSDVFATAIASRLSSSGFPFAATLLVYPASGHLLQDGYQPTTLTHTVAPGNPVVLDLGGTPAGTAAANAESWPKVLDFLDAALR